MDDKEANTNGQGGEPPAEVGGGPLTPERELQSLRGHYVLIKMGGMPLVSNSLARTRDSSIIIIEIKRNEQGFGAEVGTTLRAPETPNGQLLMMEIVARTLQAAADKALEDLNTERGNSLLVYGPGDMPKA